MQMRLLLLFVLSLFGILSCTVLASISPERALDQVVFFVIGGVAFGVIQLTSIRFPKRAAPVLFVGTVLLLLLTFALGVTTKGSTRWILLGPFRFQPAEFAKPVLALMLAWYMSRMRIESQKQFGIVACIILLVSLPVFIQPDLGSTLVLWVVGAGSLLFASVPKKLFVPWMAATLVAGIVAWNFVLYDYQKARITAFLHPAGDSAASYNATQAQIAVGSGKLFGRGLGHGIQSNLQFLPEHQTDFFFASLSEELGFVGAFGVLLLYTLLFCILLKVSDTPSTFVRVYSGAVLSYLFFQTTVHISMNIGLLPVTGIPLPLLSAGGSSVISTLIAVGLVARFSQTPDAKTLLT